jgi:hypothetical protein
LCRSESDTITADFPLFRRLHSFWKKLPNYNPQTASSQPGQLLQDEAMGVLFNPDSSDRANIPDGDFDLTQVTVNCICSVPGSSFCWIIVGSITRQPST